MGEGSTRRGRPTDYPVCVRVREIICATIRSGNLIRNKARNGSASITDVLSRTKYLIKEQPAVRSCMFDFIKPSAEKTSYVAIILEAISPCMYI